MEVSGAFQGFHGCFREIPRDLDETRLVPRGTWRSQDVSRALQESPKRFREDGVVPEGFRGYLEIHGAFQGVSKVSFRGVSWGSWGLRGFKKV